MFCLHFEHLDNELGTDYVKGKLILTLLISVWVQVNLVKATDVSGLLIQGREDFPQWVTALQVSLSIDETDWQKATVNVNTVSRI